MLINYSIFLPLFSALISGLFATRNNMRFINYVTSIMLVIAAICSINLLLNVVNHDFTAEYDLFSWIKVADFQISWGIKVDALSAMMIFVVNVVSAVVHFYSLGYMKEDKRVNRFMSYLSLFTFFMLILVTAPNLLQLFVGWEGVGLCSYLLIGFWYKKNSANNAAMKAFIVNRIGDFAFLIGIIATYVLFGSLSFVDIFTQIDQFNEVLISVFFIEIRYIDFICMMFFIGCMGKSAQLLLHSWLPDAMEGPTPVSALIHAATMVTAGVFLVVRCSALFEYSPFTLQFMTIIGSLTCIFAATIAITQNDIKKIIAYSTCSQLGYMFFACGVSAYSAGMFHLVTHAFFKALLFLTAGNVIVAMHHKQDIREMGGLRSKLPFTYLLVWIGSLAIAGVPPFAGYFSKDVILEAAFMSHSNHGFIAYILGLVAAFLTAFYSWRLIYTVFHGKMKHEEGLHKIPLTMKMPLIILTLGAIFAGYVGYNLLHIAEYDSSLWQNIIPANKVMEEIHHTPPLIKYLPLIVAIFGIVMAAIYYRYNKSLPQSTVNNFHKLYILFYNKWFFDQIYNKYIVLPYHKLAKFASFKLDQNIIDSYGPNGVAKLTRFFAKVTSKLHTGFVYHYAFSYIIGLTLILLWVFYKGFYN
jgi:NADH-quinone oxidoreductase subunit L